MLLGAIIPEPNKADNLDSLLFPGLYHLAALKKEELKVWDGFLQELYTSHLCFALETANALGMALMNGLVGHHGSFGCCIFCGMKG